MIGDILADSLYIKGSDNFDQSIVYDREANGSLNVSRGWLPTFYLESLRNNDVKTILAYEPFIESIDKFWPETFSPTTVWFDDLVMCMQSSLIYSGSGTSSLCITSLKKFEGGLYRAEVVPQINDRNQIKDIRLAQFEEGREYTIYLQHRGNRIRVYVEDEESPHWELMKAEQQFYEQFKQFPNAGRWPGEKDYKSYLAPDIFEPWPVLPLTGLKNVIDKKPVDTISHRLTSNLRLRSRPGTSAAIVDTLPEGSGVYVLRTGDSATIDGITAPWVYVAAQNGKQGWCFSGYLEEIKEEPNPAAAAQDALPEAQTNGEPENSGIPPAALIGGGIGIAGIAVLFVFIRRKKKKP
jgi:hypothetical protein